MAKSPRLRITRRPFSLGLVLAELSSHMTRMSTVFSQGEPADAVFYIQSGKVKLTVVSEQGKEAVVAILSEEAFLEEGCLAGQGTRIATATTMETSIVSVPREG